MDCNLLPLFELGTVQRAQYLLNIRLPSSSQDDGATQIKNNLRRLKEISVYVSTTDYITGPLLSVVQPTHRVTVVVAFSYKSHVFTHDL